MAQFPSLASASGIWTLKKQKRARQGSNWPPLNGVDPQFNYVTMLLPGNGTNGAQNNTFLDSSTNNFTITRNGNTTQGTFTPYGSNWSNYFNGTSDFLTPATSNAFAFGTGAWTVEAWVFVTTLQELFVFDTRNSFTTAGIGCRIASNGTLGYSGSFNLTLTSSAITANTWNHVAWVYDGTTLSGYINGVLGGTATPAFNLTMNTPKIGRNGNAASGYMAGYISNLRVVKGTAVYTSAFTPPTAPLTAITNTSLLTCQSNRFKDNSTNAFAITVNGSPSVQRFSPFNPTTPYAAGTIGGSGYFDGTGDYLVISSGNVAQFGTGDFTMEAWVYLLSHDGDESALMTGGINFSTYTQPNVNIATDGTVNLNGTQSTSNTVPLNTWTHIAVSRNSGTSRIFINGVQGSSASNTSNYNGVGAMIGLRSNGSSDFGSIHAYISNVRYVNGTGLYTSAFTPNTAPLTAISGTSLLLNFTNGGIIDNAMMNDLETVGNAQISTSVSKFGGGSLAFDGTGDWIKMTGGPHYQFGTGDFTIEFWFNGTSVSSGIPIDFRPYNTNGAYPAIYLSSGSVRYYVNTADQISGGSLSTGIWYHIALSRSGTSTRLFVNGTQVGSTYSDSNNYGSSSIPVIGASSFHLDGTGTITGYLDDLRITKGYARYTANFTPPAAPFPDQ